MRTKFFVFLGWTLGLLLLLIVCWLIGVLAGWTLWQSIALFVGVVCVLFALVWLKRQWQAWRIKRRLAKPSATVKADTHLLDADWYAGLAALKQSRLGRFGAPLYVQPWYLMLGPQAYKRTDFLRQAAAQESISAGGDHGVQLAWWLMPGMVLLEPANAIKSTETTATLVPNEHNWHHLLKLLGRSRRREPLNGLIICLPYDWLMQTDDAELAIAGQLWRKKLDELCQVYKARIPVHLLISDCQHLPGFNEWSAQWADLATQQGVGYIHENASTSSVTDFLDQAFAYLFKRMADLRLLTQNQCSQVTPSFSLPERMGLLVKPLDTLLRPAFQATPYTETPLLRGLYLSAQGGAQHNTALFTQGAFNQAIPTQRHAWLPFEKWRHWQRLAAHALVIGWLGACLGVGVFMWHSAHTVDQRLKLAQQSLRNNTPDFSGGLVSDLYALRAINYAVRTLEQPVAWLSPWQPYQNKITEAREQLENQYTRLFYHEVLLANFEPAVRKIIQNSDAGLPNKEVLALAQHLAYRINLLDARLNNQNLDRLQTPGTELGALGTLLKDQPYTSFDGLLLGEMYRDYLSWQHSTSLLEDEKLALQKALGSLGLAQRSIKWVYEWAALQVDLQDLQLHDYWPIRTDANLPVVPAAVSLAGYPRVLDFLTQLGSATQQESLWEQRKTEFNQLFLNNGLQYWFTFSDAFVHMPGLLANNPDRRTVLSSLATAYGPYNRYLADLAQLSTLIPNDQRPEWLSLAARFVSLQKLANLPADPKTALSQSVTEPTQSPWQSLHLLQSVGGDIIRNLPKDNFIRQGLDEVDASQRSLTLMQTYLQGIRSTTQSLQEGPGRALDVASKIWAYAYDAELTEVPLVEADQALNALYEINKVSTDSRSTVVWELASGPLDFTLDYAARSTGCYLQNVWEADVLGSINGVSDTELAHNLLYGPQGQVQTFLAGPISHFVVREGLRYAPRMALDAHIPLNGPFYAFASSTQQRAAENAGLQLQKEREQKTYEALTAQYQELQAQIDTLQEVKATVSLTAEPPQTNAEALLRPRSINLVLQCANAPVVLQNLNFSNSQTFAWSYANCADTELKIDYGEFQLYKQWSGSTGFVQFLQTFSSGMHRFTVADFPDKAAELQAAGVQWLDIIYRMQGQQNIIEAFAEVSALQPQAATLKAELSALNQQAFSQTTQSNTQAMPALPSQIISYCMGPSAQSVQYLRHLNQESVLDDSLTGPSALDQQTTNTQAVSGAYAIQVGVFKNAQKPLETLKNAGYAPTLQTLSLKGKTYQSVRVEGYTDQAQAQAQAKKIGELLKLQPLVVRVAQD